MADSTKRTRRRKAVKAEVVSPKGDVQSRTQESLELLVGQLENAGPQQFSDKHLDRYFDNQDKVMKYIREDHKDRAELVRDGRSFSLKLAIVFGILFISLVLIISLLDKLELDKFLGYFFAFIGGTGVGGLGVDIVRKKSKSDE